MSIGGILRPGTFQHALKLCERQLEQLRPGEVWHLLHGLKGLAPWWLLPEVLEFAGEQTGFRFARPELPESVGSCWIILAQPESHPWPLLRDAMLLPLEWRRSSKHGTGLPSQLHQMADEISRTLEKPDWRLHLSFDVGMEGVDLSLASGHLDFSSGWSSLAAGLLVADEGCGADEGGRPNPGIWASGSWNPDRGILRVERLRAKLKLADEWRAETCFVPRGQMDEASEFAKGITLRPLLQGTVIARVALDEYTYRLQGAPLPPSHAHDDAAFDRCADYWERQRRIRSAGEKVFYWTHLLPTIIERHREQLAERYPCWRCRNLITIVSGSYELVPMVAESIRCERCLLLYTPNAVDPKKDQTSAMLAVKARLENRDGDYPIECVPGQFEDSARMTSQIPVLIQEFLHGASPEDAVYDVTPGLGWMRWVADHAMPLGSWRVYVHHDSLTPADQKPKPGSERLVLWSA
ncbi:MAG: hypothetical protein ACYC3I_26315 [Gemmataceae bacterium]